jgi:hypothetical protein
MISQKFNVCSCHLAKCLKSIYRGRVGVDSPMPGQGCLASKPDEASHALYTSKLAPSVPRCREPSALPPTLPRKLAQRLGFSHSAALLGNAARERPALLGNAARERPALLGNAARERPALLGNAARERPAQLGNAAR